MQATDAAVGKRPKWKHPLSRNVVVVPVLETGQLEAAAAPTGGTAAAAATPPPAKGAAAATDGAGGGSGAPAGESLSQTGDAAIARKSSERGGGKWSSGAPRVQSTEEPSLYAAPRAETVNAALRPVSDAKLGVRVRIVLLPPPTMLHMRAHMVAQPEEKNVDDIIVMRDGKSTTIGAERKAVVATKAKEAKINLLKVWARSETLCANGCSGICTWRHR
jgi:hypothetical protein